MAWLGFPPGESLTANLSHPTCGSLRMECAYPASYVKRMGQSGNHPVEPYMVRHIAPAENPDMAHDLPLWGKQAQLP